MTEYRKEKGVKRTHILYKKQVQEIEEMSKKLGVKYNQIVRYSIDYLYKHFDQIAIDFSEEKIKAKEILR